MLRAALVDVRRHLVDAGDAAERVLDRLDDRRRHLVRAGARQLDRHVDRGRIGLRKQIDAEVAERKDAEHHERHDEHRGEDRPADAEFRQHGYSVPTASTVTFMPSARLSTSVTATRSPALTPLDDLDAIADTIAELQLAGRQLVAGRRRTPGSRRSGTASRLYGSVRICSTFAVSRWTRANVPGLSSASRFGTSASKGNARVCVLTAGLMRDTLPVIVLSGYASTRSSTGWPT